MDDDSWIAIVIFGLPVVGWITVRMLDHRERMAMLQRGIVPPPRGVKRRRWEVPPGYQATSGPMPGPMPPPPVYGDESAQCTLRKGIVTSAVGIALFIGLSFIGYHAGDGLLQPPTWHPGPWLLGGLIPMFVGFAQIAIGLMSGAQFGFRQPPMPPTGYPPEPGPFPRYGPPPQPGSPGPRFEELARPVPPPDRP